MWNLDENLKKEPLYVRIYMQIKKMIQEGKFKEHQKLPSKRKLAQTLKVSPLTVEQAYLQLIAEGYVYAIEKSGYFVNVQVEMLLQNKKIPATYKQDETIKENYQYSFETHTIDTSLFPRSTWAKLTRQVLVDYDYEILNESHPQGLFLLRNEIARYLEIYRGMKVDVNQIVLGSGSTSIIGILVEILGRHNHYAMEDPGYQKIYQLFKANDVKLSLIELNEFGLSIESLKKSQASIVHITPSHQFPTGIVMPIQRRVELLNWAQERKDRFIIEDDYDSEFRYQGKPIPALQGLDQHDSIIYMNTFTKTLAPSFRINYMVLPKRLILTYKNISNYHGCTVPNLEQYILYSFMNKGYFERHINKMRNLYKQKLDTIMDIIQAYPDFEIKNYEAGLHCILCISKAIEVNKLTNFLEFSKIKISPLMNKGKIKLFQNQTQLILGYAGIPIEKIDHHIHKLLHALVTYLNEFSKNQSFR